MIQINYNGFFKIVLKLLVLIFLTYFLLNKLDMAKIKNAFIETNKFYFILALLFFIVSQFISSLRLKFLLLKMDIQIGSFNNFKLYLLGMFYNLFLPGGIGGDAFKIIKYSEIKNTSKKSLIKLLVGDRLSGLIILILFCFFLISIFPPTKMDYYMTFLFETRYFTLPIIVILIAYLLYHVLSILHFVEWVILYLYAFAVQFCQLAAFYCIIKSLCKYSYQDISKLLTLFPLSSIASTIPLSFGGLGMRELVFFWGADYYNLEKEWTLVASILFFAITFLVSLSGIWYVIFPKKIII